MPDLEPITREEMLLDGQDLEPITRKEMFIKRIYDKTQVIPEPITREEIFLKKAGDETTDVTIEQLNVSENGTYSEEGVAYSPVIVNVPAPPIPDNAYLLNDVEGLPSDIATFNDGSALPMPSLKVGIEPQQDLHGYDSPWVGGSGKNKLNLDFTNDTDSFSGLTFSHTDSTIKLKGTVSGQNYRIFNLTLPPNVDLNTDYTLSAVVTGTVSRCLVSIYFKNGNIDTENIRVEISDTTPKNTKQISAQSDNATFVIEGLQSGSYFDCEVKIQLEKGSSATSFAPYSNICPISGHTGLDAWVRGKNLFDWTNQSSFAGFIDTSTQKFKWNSDYKTFYIKCKPNTTYTISKEAGKTFRVATSVQVPTEGVPYIGTIANHTGTSITYTTESNAIYLSVLYWSSVNEDTKTANELAQTIQIEKGLTATTYTPYNPNSQTIQVSWQTEAGEVYGGEIDLVSGVLTVTDGYIASYDGEILPSTWISDSDVYAEGTTPTIGAEVCYELATPLTIQLTPTVVKSLLGSNNVWADCGEILEGQYFSKEE